MYLFAPWGHQRHEVFWKKTSKETHHLVWAKFGETEIWNSDIYVRACKLNVRSSTSMAAAIFNHDFENLMELFQRCFFISELACHSACASCTHAHIFLYHKFGELGNKSCKTPKVCSRSVQLDDTVVFQTNNGAMEVRMGPGWRWSYRGIVKPHAYPPAGNNTCRTWT